MQQALKNNIEGLISFERCSNADLRSANVDEEFHFEDKVTIGQGTYGKVYKVLSRLDGKFYALKEIKPTRPEYGFPITALREIKFLNKLKNNYLIRQQKICSRVQTKNNLTRIKAYCVMDFMDSDIYRLLKQNKMKTQNFSLPQTRSILNQILLGLKYLHENRIIHRDIKSANILVDKLGQVKIADFGLAKYIPLSEIKNKTHNVVTLPYRAPEILFTRGNYDFKIDIWSFGCIAVELVTKKLCFDARNENEYIKQVFQLCGSPDESSWPDILKQDLYQQYSSQIQKQKFERQLFSIIRSKVPDIDNDLIDLINKTLVLNPSQRLDVNQALNHQFFKKGNLEQDQILLKGYFQDIKIESIESHNGEVIKKKEINIDIDILASQPIKRIKL